MHTVYIEMNCIENFLPYQQDAYTSIPKKEDFWFFFQKKKKKKKPSLEYEMAIRIFISLIWVSQAETEPKTWNICTNMHVLIQNFGAKVEVV